MLKISLIDRVLVKINFGYEMFDTLQTVDEVLVISGDYLHKNMSY